MTFVIAALAWVAACPLTTTPCPLPLKAGGGVIWVNVLAGRLLSGDALPSGPRASALLSPAGSIPRDSHPRAVEEGAGARPSLPGAGRETGRVFWFQAVPRGAPPCACVLCT